jgi:magnesium-transporting ATPase (P-type)
LVAMADNGILIFQHYLKFLTSDLTNIFKTKFWQWPKEKDRRQYNDKKKKTEDNTSIVFCLFLLVIVLSSVFLFWSLYCLLSFGHCIVFCLFLLVIVLSFVFFF